MTVRIPPQTQIKKGSRNGFTDRESRKLFVTFSQFEEKGISVVFAQGRNPAMKRMTGRPCIDQWRKSSSRCTEVGYFCCSRCYEANTWWDKRELQCWSEPQPEQEANWVWLDFCSEINAKWMRDMKLGSQGDGRIKYSDGVKERGSNKKALSSVLMSSSYCITIS